MKEKIKQAWIAALRSGEYEQGKKQLRKGDHFCCLGVLCNLHAQAHPKIAAQQRTTDAYMGISGVLPVAVVKWAGLNTRDPIVKASTTESKTWLSLINDNGVSFDYIADLIEKQL